MGWFRSLGKDRPWAHGCVIVAAYFAFRLVVDFAKHAHCRWLGLSAIQWVTVLGLSVVVPDLRRWLTARPGPRRPSHE